jgi:hypothetical protein
MVTQKFTNFLLSNELENVNFQTQFYMFSILYFEIVLKKLYGIFSSKFKKL